ncbi:MAG: sugar phosphate isomerase/epimerase [Planctomycetaceae bacterium]|jgi:sugar phosphate isomerase/epimerase|nr:sugar phosphate isomerase/epimerase [Planctomycetaceae bacterium]
MTNKLSRRCFLNVCGTSSLLGLSLRMQEIFGQESESLFRNQRFRVGICDWDLLAAGNPKSFEIAKELGFEGVEISYQPDGKFSLSKQENRKKFLDAAEKTGVLISSVAMGILNDRPLATTPEAENWVDDCIAAMTEMNLKHVLLAFFGNGDIKDKTDSRKIVMEKLKRLAPKAEKQGKILGIESYLNAAEHLDMLQSIGSSSVKVYYDEQNMLTKGYPIYDDLELLLKEKAVCQIHLKEYGARLGEGKVDFQKIRNLLEQYDYRGWVVAESSVKGNWKESQSANAAIMRKIFQ